MKKKKEWLLHCWYWQLSPPHCLLGGVSRRRSREKKLSPTGRCGMKLSHKVLSWLRLLKHLKDETGIAVDIVFNGREIRKTLQPALDAGEEIDIFDEDISRVNSTWGKYLLPLEEYVAKSYPSTDGESYSDAVSTALIDLARQAGDGTLKTAPYQPFAFVVMYNKDHFNKAGITETPKTWAEFENVCAKLVQAGITPPITVDDAYMAAFFGYNMARLAGLERTMEMANNNEFNDPAVLEFGKIWSDFAKKGYISKKAASNIYPAGQIEEIAAGKVAMYLNGTWLPNEIKGNAPNFNWGAFAWPEMGRMAMELRQTTMVHSALVSTLVRRFQTRHSSSSSTSPLVSGIPDLQRKALASQWAKTAHGPNRPLKPKPSSTTPPHG